MEVTKVWRDYVCPVSNTVEVVYPFQEKDKRVVHYTFVSKEQLADAVSEARKILSPDMAYKYGRFKQVDMSLPMPLYKMTWNKGGLIALHHRVHGITKFIKNKLLPIHQVRSYKRHNHKLSAVRARNLGKSVDKELKCFAIGKTHGLLSTEASCIVQHLFGKDISLFESGTLVSNKLENDDKTKQPVLCKGKLYSGYAGTEIDIVGFDHLKREIVVVELKMTTDSIRNMEKKYHSSKLDKSSGFSKSVLGSYLAQTACTALMFKSLYNLSVPFRAMLLICEAGGKCCKSYDVAPRALNPQNFQGWIPGFT